MNPSLKYALPTAWLVLFAYRLLLGGSDRLTLWALRLLTIAILVTGCIWVARFVEERIRSARRGAPVFTQATVRGLLLATAVVGLALRIVGWNPGHEGVVAWIGGIMLILSIVGLIVFQFLVERGARSGRESFYFNPSWKYGLIGLCIATLTIQGLAKPEGAASTINVGVFWAALIALIVQTVGRWFQRRRGHGRGAPMGPPA